MTAEHTAGLELAGSRVLVTGGTSGIGFAIARGFCEAGAQVVINGRDVDRGVTAVKELYGHPVTYIEGDMSNVDCVDRMVAATVDQLGGLDVLVNNAGGSGRGTIENLDPDRWDYTMALNVRGPAFAMRAALKALRASERGGCITNVTSIAGRDHPAGLGAYAASKAALNALTVVAAKEEARYGVRVNAVAPGLVETDMSASLPEPVKAGLTKAIPLGRTMGTPEQVAGTCVFLATPAAGYITGQVIAVDGGLRL